MFQSSQTGSLVFGHRVEGLRASSAVSAEQRGEQLDQRGETGLAADLSPLFLPRLLGPTCRVEAGRGVGQDSRSPVAEPNRHFRPVSRQPTAQNGRESTGQTAGVALRTAYKGVPWYITRHLSSGGTIHHAAEPEYLERQGGVQPDHPAEERRKRQSSGVPASSDDQPADESSVSAPPGQQSA